MTSDFLFFKTLNTKLHQFVSSKCKLILCLKDYGSSTSGEKQVNYFLRIILRNYY